MRLGTLHYDYSNRDPTRLGLDCNCTAWLDCNCTAWLFAEQILKHLTDVLQPLKRSLDVLARVGDGSSQAVASGSKRPRSVPPSGGSIGSDFKEQPVVFVETEDLGDVMDQMDDPFTVYEFQGKHMRYFGSGNPTIVRGMTWRNGTIRLSSTQSLVVLSKDVTLCRMSVLRGQTGVNVSSGGSVSLLSCKVDGGERGVRLTGNSHLLARNIAVRSSVSKCFRLEESSAAVIADVDITGQGLASVYMSGTSSMVAKWLHFTDFMTHTLHLQNKASASLTDCTMTLEPTRLVEVTDEGSLVMSNCTCVEQIIKGNAATIVINHNG